MESKPDKCPECGSGKVASILFGFPGFEEELRRELKAGEVALGGCGVSDDNPRWQCMECEHRWGKRGPRIRIKPD